MNLIEKYGGYEAVKQAAVNYKNSGDRVTAAGLELQCLEYRRQHNIFEVGDKVVYNPPIGIETVVAVNDEHLIPRFLWQIRHATDEEIEAGYRLPD